MTWHIRDFAPEDLEAALRLDTVSATTPQQPLFDFSDVAQATFERTVDSGVRSHADTGDYLRVIEVTRPTLTADQVSQFDADIDTYARV